MREKSGKTYESEFYNICNISQKIKYWKHLFNTFIIIQNNNMLHYYIYIYIYIYTHIYTFIHSFIH